MLNNFIYCMSITVKYRRYILECTMKWYMYFLFQWARVALNYNRRIHFLWEATLQYVSQGICYDYLCLISKTFPRYAIDTIWVNRSYKTMQRWKWKELIMTLLPISNFNVVFKSMFLNTVANIQFKRNIRNLLNQQYCLFIIVHVLIPVVHEMLGVQLSWHIRILFYSYLGSIKTLSLGWVQNL